MPSHPEVKISVTVSASLLGEAQRSASASQIPVGQFLKEIIESEVATRRLQALPEIETPHRSGRPPARDNDLKIAMIAHMKSKGFSTKQIAAALDLSPGALKIFAHRHREAIQLARRRSITSGLVRAC